MKKYFLGITAVVLALSLVAFTTTSHSGKLVNVRFQFDGTTSGETNPANWDYAAGAGCGGSLDACVIDVPSTVVSGTSPNFFIDATKLQSVYGTSTLPMTTSSGHTAPTSKIGRASCRERV